MVLADRGGSPCSNILNISEVDAGPAASVRISRLAARFPALPAAIASTLSWRPNRFRSYHARARSKSRSNITDARTPPVAFADLQYDASKFR
jgi:hypothetical protein